MMLTLILNFYWYGQIQSGLKTSEYREIKPYWEKRLEGKTYKTVKLRKGYKKGAYMIFEIVGIKRIKGKNDLNLAECYEIKLGKKVEEI